jgi:MtrB/PioB family decaheme-associated outer membrane protein
MKNRLLLSCLLGLFLAPYAYADDNPFSGGVFLGGQALSLDHQSAKFNEYNDIAPGLVGGGNASYDNDKYHLDIDAVYLGGDDMHLKMNGGKWGSFKFSFFYTEFPHNYSFEDRTIYTDPGSQDLTLPGRASATPKNSALWPSTSFDYKIDRKDVGGAVDVTAISPFFFNVTANHLEREGDMPWSGHSAYAFGDTVELPLPVDDHTTNTNVLLGWKSKQFYAALGAGFSEYGNSAEFTRFQDPFPTGATQAYGTIVGPPDNRSWSVNFAGTAKLPLSSTFALNAGYTENTSQTTLLNTLETGTLTGVSSLASPTVTRLILSQPTFNGDVEYLNLGANLTSNPVKDLTTKFYFRYLDRRDDSDQVAFTNPTNASTLASGSVMNALFSYDKTTAGAEATYRFLKNLKGILGYDFSDTRRQGGDDFVQVFPGIDNVLDTEDNTFRGEIVYNPFDWLGGRLKYQKLFRDTNTEIEPGTAAATELANNVTRFDIGNRTQDMWRLTADLTPLETLDVSLEYAYKLDDYNDTVLGLTKAEENEFVLDGSYVWKGIKFFAFFDYDISYTEQTERYLASASANGNPAAPPSPTAFNWNADLRNNNYAYGLGTTIPIIKDKVACKLQYDFEKNEGYADFTSQSFTAAQAGLINNGNIDIAPWDDYTRQNISATINYTYSKNVSLTFGYLYSQFRLNDSSLNGYQYTPSSSVYLTGAYTDQNYNASVYYVKLYYRF